MGSWFRRKKNRKSDPPPSEGETDSGDFEEIIETPWGVPVLDVQSFTQTMLSTSRDPEMASRALSYQGTEGPEFAAGRVGDRSAPGELVLPIDPPIADGVLRLPRSMEEKWVIYLHDGELLFVRSWLREVVARAEVRIEDESAVIGTLRGDLAKGTVTPEFNRAVLEYLVRDYALGEGLPAPIPFPFPYRGDPEHAATYAFSMFGNHPRFLTDATARLQAPSKPLCAHSALHLAVARRDAAGIREALEAGVPSTARGPDGLAALHWIFDDETLAAEILLDHGDPADLRSRQGTTPLMHAVQNQASRHIELFLERGGDVNAKDHRGFTALHRAAEAGMLDLVDLLLEHGADRDAEAENHTAISLAELRGETAIVERLRRT